MTGTRSRFRRLGRLGLAVGLTMVMSVPAGASGNSVTICHVTNSASNPYVIIEIDVAAFDGNGDNDHAHHVSHDGRVDLLFVDGECGGDIIN